MVNKLILAVSVIDADNIVYRLQLDLRAREIQLTHRQGR